MIKEIRYKIIQYREYIWNLIKFIEGLRYGDRNKDSSCL